MKKLLFSNALVVLAMVVAFPAFSDEPQVSQYGRGPGYGCDWGSGYGWGGERMGPGYGPGMQRGSWGMHGREDMMNHGWGRVPAPRDWESMKPEQRDNWEKMNFKIQMETLELRKQLATKQIELETYWYQPNVDPKKIEELSDEVAKLRAELGKKRDRYLLECRKEFGDQVWACPGGW